MTKKDSDAVVQTPEGASGRSPEALTGLEVPLGSAIFSLISNYGPGVGQAIYRAWKGNVSLFVQLNAS